MAQTMATVVTQFYSAVSVLKGDIFLSVCLSGCLYLSPLVSIQPLNEWLTKLSSLKLSLKRVNKQPII